MTSPRNRLLVGALAAALVIGSMGCGFIRSAKNVAANASTLGDLSSKLENADKLTYQAEYKLDDGSKVTVAQQPPNSAAVGESGRYISTADTFIFCDTEDSKLTCQKTPNQGGSTGTAGDAAFFTGIGSGFISAPFALTVLTAAILIPSAKVDKSEQKIAGQKSTCAKVSNLEDAQKDTAEKDRLHDFTVCITDSGILSRFTGTGGDGTKQGVELTSYSDKVDTSLFKVPDGATVTDLGALPTATDTDDDTPDASPSASDDSGDPSPSDSPSV